MTTELVLAPAVRTWEELSESLTVAIADLVSGSIAEARISVPGGGERIVAAMIGDEVRLAAAGNDTLVGGDRLTVRDERAVIAVGFSVASATWGTFYWDWTPPVQPGLVASGIVRTMRDIYKVDPADLELSVTL